MTAIVWLWIILSTTNTHPWQLFMILGPVPLSNLCSVRLEWNLLPPRSGPWRKRKNISWFGADGRLRLSTGLANPHFSPVWIHQQLSSIYKVKPRTSTSTQGQAPRVTLFWEQPFSNSVFSRADLKRGHPDVENVARELQTAIIRL